MPLDVKSKNDSEEVSTVLQDLLKETIEYTYPNLNAFAAWYMHNDGLVMMQNNIKTVQSLKNDLEENFKRLSVKEGDKDQKASSIKLEHLYILRCLFIDGELSKHLFERSKEKIGNEWTTLFDAFKKLRNEIKKSAEAEGLQKFEARLNSSSPEMWTQIIESYCSVLDPISMLSSQFPGFKWEDCKQQDWSKVIPALNDESKKRLGKLESNLRNLRRFITTGNWENQREKMNIEGAALKSPVTLESPKQITRAKYVPGLTLLVSHKEKRGRSIGSFDDSEREKEKLSPKSLFTDGAKESKVSRKRGNAEPGLIESLENLQWTLSSVAFESSKMDSLGDSNQSQTEKVSEFRLVLVRESAKILMRELPKFLSSISEGESRVAFPFPHIVSIQMLRDLVFDFCNKKAHLHRLIAASSSEIYEQSGPTLVETSIKPLLKRVTETLNFLKQEQRKKARSISSVSPFLEEPKMTH